MAADINTTYAGEDVPFGEIDYTAPEQGSRKPSVKPGTYDFIFNLPDENAFEDKLIKQQPHFQVNYYLTTTIDGEERTVSFQRATTYKSEKMKNSAVGELLRSLGLTVTTLTKRNIIEALQGVSGRGTVRAEVGWRTSEKQADNTYAEYTTYGKRGTSPWPRDAQGAFTETVALPSGKQAYGKAEVVNFKLPR